jgi:hypothetical protein
MLIILCFIIAKVINWLYWLFMLTMPYYYHRKWLHWDYETKAAASKGIWSQVPGVAEVFLSNRSVKKCKRYLSLTEKVCLGVDTKLKARDSARARQGLARARLGSKVRQAKPKPSDQGSRLDKPARRSSQTGSKARCYKKIRCGLW